MSQNPKIELKKGRSGVLVVPYRLRTVILLKGDKEVGRIPVRLEFDKKTVVRY